MFKSRRAHANDSAWTRLFTRVAKTVDRVTGRPIAFVIAALCIVVWGAVGPFFRFSAGWQLAISTLTSIVTFLMVFLIQNTQSRDTAAIQIKLAEVLRALKHADNAMLDAEDLSVAEQERARAEYKGLARAARSVEKGVDDT